MYHMNKSESLAPRHDSCQVWLNFDEASLKKKMKQLRVQRAHSSTCYPPQGPIGATLGTHMNNFYSSPIKVSTHRTSWLLHVWIWRRRFLKFTVFCTFGALPLGPHGGHRNHMNKFASPTHKDDSYQVWLKLDAPFWRRRWKCKSLRTTDDGRRTKTDGNSSLEPLAQVS